MLVTASTCTPGQADNLFADRFSLGLSTLAAYYNDPGVDRQTGTDKKIDLKLVKLIEEAQVSVDMAVYNLSRESIIEAVTVAEARNIKVRMVGDVDEVVTDGYRAILRTPIPFSLGNSSAIQHNKFAVIDKKFLFMGTANFTTSGFIRNNNNYLIMESKSMAKAYTDEFEQMFFGRYGSKKVPLTTNNNHRIDFTNIELYFSPYGGQDAMDRLIALANGAKNNIKYMIFADTHDELTTARIRAARRGLSVRGVHDKTFVRGVSEEAPRLYSAAQYMPNLQVRRDGNEHTATAGLSSHGGKLHTKTMIFDDSIVCTGSFNWSGNAVENNDENMVCIHNPFIALEIGKQWQQVWEVSQPVGDILRHPSGSAANAGDVIISEVNWAGSSPSPTDFVDKTDDWIELYNTTDSPIDLSHWTISWEAGEPAFYPIPDEYNWYKPGVHSKFYFTGKLVIPAKGHFLIKAQNESIDQYDNKISGVKNFRLGESGFHIRLYDPTMNMIDEAGNGDPPVAGTYNEASGQRRTFSMERFFYPTGHALAGKALPGTSPGSWYTSNGNGGQSSSGSDCTNSNPVFRTVCGEYQIFDSFKTGSIGTPRYSGSGTASNPTSVQSNAFGSFHQNLNIPIRAWSTGSTQARIQMRWSLSSVQGPDDIPLVDVFPTGICTGPPAGRCATALDPNDHSVIIVTTLAQTPGTQYTFDVGAGNTANDVTGGFVPSRMISFTGGPFAKATFRINRVGPLEAKDLVELSVVTAGTANGLGIYHYKNEFDPSPPVLLYRLGDFEVATNHLIRLTLNKNASDISDDDRCPNGCSPGGAPAGTTVPPDTGQTIHIEHNGGDGDTVWHVFSRDLFLDSSDGIIFLAYGANQTPIDAMCYSNRDGDMQEGLMRGGMRTLYNYSSSLYNLSVFPVDANNDFLVQSGCSDWSRGSSAGDILVRVANNKNAGDFQCQNGGNPC